LQNRKLKIGIVVGEVSGDTLGAKLIRSFREQGFDAEFEGIGGPQMLAEGFKSYYPMDILSVMGIVEVLKDIKLMQNLKGLAGRKCWLKASRATIQWIFSRSWALLKF